ncbi:hypothetical protein I7I48_00408 [Histoplasma ohiense]|nr:hypothetical protein I7I48_00408 [Histoplasma ohiense (nom. inval.)]
MLRMLAPAANTSYYVSSRERRGCHHEILLSEALHFLVYMTGTGVHLTAKKYHIPFHWGMWEVLPAETELRAVRYRLATVEASTWLKSHRTLHNGCASDARPTQVEETPYFTKRKAHRCHTSTV